MEHVIRYLQKEQSPIGNEVYCYSLRNSIFSNEPPIFLLSKVKPHVMDILVFAMQKRYADIAEDEYSILSHKDLADLLVAEQYATLVSESHIPESISGYRSFDLHDNWNIWEPEWEKIEGLPVLQSFNWEKLMEAFYEINWKQKQLHS